MSSIALCGKLFHAREKGELTVQGFYRRAMWCPFVVAAVGWPSMAALLAGKLEIAGVFSLFIAGSATVLLGPYSLYLVIVSLFWPPGISTSGRLSLRCPSSSGEER